MKAKKIRGIALIALLLVSVLCLGWGIQQLGLPIKAYADTEFSQIIKYFS